LAGILGGIAPNCHGFVSRGWFAARQSSFAGPLALAACVHVGCGDRQTIGGAGTNGRDRHVFVARVFAPLIAARIFRLLIRGGQGGVTGLDRLHD